MVEVLLGNEISWFICLFFSGIRFQPEYLSQSHQEIQVSIQFSCFNRFAVINILSYVSWVFFFLFSLL